MWLLGQDFGSRLEISDVQGSTVRPSVMMQAPGFKGWTRMSNQPEERSIGAQTSFPRLEHRFHPYGDPWNNSASSQVRCTGIIMWPMSRQDHVSSQKSQSLRLLPIQLLSFAFTFAPNCNMNVVCFSTSLNDLKLHIQTQTLVNSLCSFLGASYWVKNLDINWTSRTCKDSILILQERKIRCIKNSMF